MGPLSSTRSFFHRADFCGCSFPVPARVSRRSLHYKAVILDLPNRYCSVRATLFLTLHGRGSISSRPWEDLVTTVGRSYHGRGKVKIAVPSRENALYSFLNLLYIYLTPILSFHLINKIFIFHLQYYLSTFT